MSFNPNTGGTITLATAQAETSAFRSAYPGENESFAFGKNIINTLLAEQDGDGDPAQGMRIYMAVKNGKFNVILRPIDKDGNDIEVEFNLSAVCPTNCPNNPL